MNVQNSNRQEYSTPLIISVKLDSAISLALESVPATGPGEPTGFAPEYFRTEPFKIDVV